MKYVALLSGGKDSCFNLVHCKKNGHELVAAASLKPEAGKEELDSYMYQTVGQDAIEFVARALGVPLYRKTIVGTAVEQGSEYGPRKPADGGIVGDETEDLFDLLSTVKEHHPDIGGVSVGAILSNYQRVRVEHVCRRLSLVPLCYLWQRDQAELFDEMLQAGMEAVLIKVAGIGLTTAHLGKSLSQMRNHLFKLNSLYGSHICGEGGEYESLTLDCPLFQSRIKLDEVDTVIHSDNDFATVAYLRVKKATLEPKNAEADESSALAVPPLLKAPYDSLRDTLLTIDVSNSGALAGRADKSFAGGVIGATKETQDWVTISNVQATVSDTDSTSLEDEVRECFDFLIARLSEHGLTLSNCVHINMFIESTGIFARVNAVYGTYFGTSPPTRACVAVELLNRKRIVLDCLAFKERQRHDRQALHVQGLSYWAPANIGPYSQAVIVNDRVFISGQIGLVPSSLSLPPPPPSLATEFALSCQHVSRVKAALREGTTGGGGGRWEGHTQSTIYWLDHTENINLVKMGHKLLQQALEEEGDDTATPAPTLFVVVKELPKGAIVEKQVWLHTGRVQLPSEDDDDDDDVIWASKQPVFGQGKKLLLDGNGNHYELHWEVSKFEEGSSSSSVIVFIKGLVDGAALSQAFADSRVNLAHVASIKYFYATHLSPVEDTLSKVFKTAVPPVQPIKCSAISSQTADGWNAALSLMVV